MNMSMISGLNNYYPLVNVYMTMEKITMFFMGKLTISIYGHGFNNFLYVYQEGKPPFSYGFPMVFLWFLT